MSSITITIAIAIIVTIAMRMRIVLVVIQRIPADVIAKREVEHKRDEGRTPPTSIPIELAARAPRPVTVVINPTPVVIRRPAPWFVANPSPTIRRTPGPLPVTIRRPIAVNADGARKRTPDPTVVVSPDPVAIGLEILAAPNIFAVILGVVLETLREIALALGDPTIDRIRRRGCHQIPVAGVFAVDDQFRRTTVAKRETRSV
jgi:hypothetical protein